MSDGVVAQEVVDIAVPLTSCAHIILSQVDHNLMPYVRIQITLRHNPH